MATSPSLRGVKIEGEPGRSVLVVLKCYIIRCSTPAMLRASWDGSVQSQIAIARTLYSSFDGSVASCVGRRGSYARLQKALGEGKRKGEWGAKWEEEGHWEELSKYLRSRVRTGLFNRVMRALLPLSMSLVLAITRTMGDSSGTASSILPLQVTL